MQIVAGLFLAAFGFGGAVLIAKRFPNARFLTVGYALMGTGGLGFVVWAAGKSMAAGVSAAALLAAGGACGAVGALRKELRP